MIFIWNLSIVIGYIRPSVDVFSMWIQIPLLIIFWIGVLCSDLTVSEMTLDRNPYRGNEFFKGVCAAVLTGVGIMMTIYFFVLFDELKLILSLCFIPQIVRNAKQSDLISVQATKELLGCTISYLYLIYYRLFPKNILHTYPDAELCEWFIALWIV